MLRIITRLQEVNSSNNEMKLMLEKKDQELRELEMER
jgi:hypothetical protein